MKNKKQPNPRRKNGLFRGALHYIFSVVTFKFRRPEWIKINAIQLMLQSLLIQHAAAPIGTGTALDAIDLREIALRASCGRGQKGALVFICGRVLVCNKRVLSIRGYPLADKKWIESE